MKSADTLLVGNSFPLSLVRRRVTIAPRARDQWQAAAMQASAIHSFWGHSNTLNAASQWSGLDLTPRTERPALALDSQGLPTLNGETFTHCWVLSPDYTPGFRPKEREVVPPEAILGWQALEIVWE